MPHVEPQMEDDGGNARRREGNAVVVHQSSDPQVTIAPGASTGLASTSSHQASPPSLSSPPYPYLGSTKAEPLPPSPAPKGPSTLNQQQSSNNNNLRRRSLPFTFPPLFFRSNTSSTSLAASTAEGKPIPIDNTTAAHQISALKKLNSTYPSAAAGGRGHTYAKSTGAQNSTYSQPVLVRTYSGPSPAQSSYGGVRSSQRQGPRSSRYRPPSSSRGISRRVPLPLSSKAGSDLSSRPTKPALSGGVGNGSNSYSNSSNLSSSASGETGSSGGINYTANEMAHHHRSKKSSSGSISGALAGKLPLPWGQWTAAGGSRKGHQDEAKLPPLEAFSFKGFMADMQTQGGTPGENDIGADLDRIAEICARSRYSLSSQYEMHVAPHGSGISFVTGGGPGSNRRSKGHGHSHSGVGGVGGAGSGAGAGGNGPTLQAISSDDDNEIARSHQQRGKRRSGLAAGRRRSVAYGTLETIMSSSRSSEEDKTKKKSAAEIVGEVRGRAARKSDWANSASTGSGESNSTTQGEAGSQGHGGVAPVDGTESTKGTETERRRHQNQSQSQTSEVAKARLARKKSASFATAVMDSSRSQQHHYHNHDISHRKPHDSSSKNNDVTPSSSASALVSEPSMPQTSSSHLGVRTAAAAAALAAGSSEGMPSSSSPAAYPGGGGGPEGYQTAEVHLADELPREQSSQDQYQYPQQHRDDTLPRTRTRSTRSLSSYTHSHSGGGGWVTWLPAWGGKSTTTNNTSANTNTTTSTHATAAGITPRGGTGGGLSSSPSSSGKNKNHHRNNAEGSLRQLLVKSV